MSTGWNIGVTIAALYSIINLLGNEYWLEQSQIDHVCGINYKPTGK